MNYIYIFELHLHMFIYIGIFQKLELILQHNTKTNCPTGCFLIGNKATAADFHLYEMILQYDYLGDIYYITMTIYIYNYLFRCK